MVEVALIPAVAARPYSQCMPTSPTTTAMPALRPLLETWRGDPGGTYQSWFLWPERLKNFRSIRQGLAQVVAEIDAGTFGTA
jgi:type II restriction enzyme